KDVPNKGPSLELAQAVKFTAANEIDPASLPTVRAIAAELLAHPAWSVTIGVRPAPAGKGADAEPRAAAMAAAIRRFARREQAASVAAWDAVKAAPRAPELGIDVLLVTPEAAPKK